MLGYVFRQLFGDYSDQCGICLGKEQFKVAKKGVTPLIFGYLPDMYVAGELKEDGVQWYQGNIGTLIYGQCKLVGYTS